MRPKAALYANTSLGYLNLSYLVIGVPVFFTATSAYQEEPVRITLRLDTLFAVWVSGGSLIVSILCYVSCCMDPGLVYRHVYRLAVAWMAASYALATSVFACQELFVGTTILGRISASAAIANCLVYIVAAIVSFQPTNI